MLRKGPAPSRVMRNQPLVSEPRPRGSGFASSEWPAQINPPYLSGNVVRTSVAITYVKAPIPPPTAHPCLNKPSKTSTMSSGKKPAAPPSSTTPSKPPGSSSSNIWTRSNWTKPTKPRSKARNTPSSSTRLIAGKPGPRPKARMASSITIKRRRVMTSATSSI